jgi:hypothetical protein
LNTPYVSTFNAPLTNEPYSKIFGDFNPIHVNSYFSPRDPQTEGQDPFLHLQSYRNHHLHALFTGHHQSWFQALTNLCPSLSLLYPSTNAAKMD